MPETYRKSLFHRILAVQYSKDLSKELAYFQHLYSYRAAEGICTFRQGHHRHYTDPGYCQTKDEVQCLEQCLLRYLLSCLLELKI